MRKEIFFVFTLIIFSTPSCTKDNTNTSNTNNTITPIINSAWEQSKGTELLNIQSLICVGSYNFSGGSTGIMKSMDFGGNFVVSNTGNSDITPTRGFTNDGNQIFNCTGKGVFTSTDFGANWISKSNGLSNLLNSGIVYVSPYLFVVTPTGVFSSVDKGNNWISAGLTNTDVRCITSIGNTIFVGTNGSGVYKSSDWGKTWTQINNGLKDLSIFDLAFNDKFLLAGTNTQGVFRFDINNLK